LLIHNTDLIEARVVGGEPTLDVGDLELDIGDLGVKLLGHLLEGSRA
jgi:hypothetical protein